MKQATYRSTTIEVLDAEEGDPMLDGESRFSVKFKLGSEDRALVGEDPSILLTAAKKMIDDSKAKQPAQPAVAAPIQPHAFVALEGSVGPCCRVCNRLRIEHGPDPVQQKPLTMTDEESIRQEIDSAQAATGLLDGGERPRLFDENVQAIELAINIASLLPENSPDRLALLKRASFAASALIVNLYE